MAIIYTIIEVYDGDVDVLKSTTNPNVAIGTLLTATNTHDMDPDSPDDGVSTTDPADEENLVHPRTEFQEWVKGGHDGVLQLWAQGSSGRRWEVSADED